MTALKQIVIFLLIWNHLVVGIPLDDFYPFGSDVFDTLIAPNDDRSSPGIPLTMSFPFFDTNHDMLFVNNNGAISFTVAVSQFTPDPFPLSGSLELIAPYWADVDTMGTGIPNNVWYRQTTDATLLARAQDMIQAAFIDQGSFVPDYIFIATWDHVGYFSQGTSGTDRTNTFQCVLATNGISSFVIFLYADGGIQWTTGGASGGSGGLGGTPAQVGFNAGDGLRFASVPGSRTDDIINVDTTSNVGVPGVWIFRVDEQNVAFGGCQDQFATITLAPRVGSVLGGTAVLVSGPCLQEDDNIACIFDGEEVEGSYLSEMLAVCITPPFSSIGRVTFQLIVEGSDGIVQGTETFLSAPYDRSFIQLDHPSLVFDAGDNCTLTWTPSSIVPLADPMSYTVDIGLYCIEESTGVVNEIATLENGLPNSGMATVNIPESISYSNDVCPAFILISLSEPSGNGTGMITRRQTDTTVDIVQLLLRRGIRLGLWSGIRYIIISADLHLACVEWCGRQEAGIGEDLLMEVEPCPPTVDQARQDPRFAEDNPLAVGVFHPDASTCFRQIVMNREGEDCLPGSQCCYDDDGQLIPGPPSGGTVDIASPQGNVRCYLQHFFQDVLPSIYCCTGLFPDCQSYYLKRPSVPQTGYTFPIPAFMFGDPHLVTLDGLKYTFNGQGEYTLVETEDNSFFFEGRMVAATDVSGNPALGTVFSAVVATQDDSDTVQLEVSRRGLDVLVDGVRVEFEGVPEQEFNNVTVSDLGNNTFSARFSNGGYIEAQEANDIISFLFFRLPNSYQGQTRGLLGNFNGDTSDDLVPQFGNQPISTNSSLQEIHEMFGVTWIIDNPADSLFTYGLGESWSTFFNPGFTPAFQLTFTDPQLEAEATALCQGDFFCLFDAATTSSIDIGLSTLASSQVFDMILNLSTPSDSFCGAEEVDGYFWRDTPGGELATLPCSEGSEEVATRECSPTGEWQMADLSQCALEDCGAEEVDGYFWPDTPGGELATLPCSEGSMEVATRECSPTGEWQMADLSQCALEDCGAEEVDGYFWPDTPGGELATLPCSEGSRGRVATRECSLTGEWQMADLRQCENCGAEEVDGYFWRDTPGGELATLPCSEGSEEVATRECSPTGEWQMADLSQCALEDCGAEEVDGYFWPDTPGGELATLPCSEGSRGRVATRECSLTGEWQMADLRQCENCGAEEVDGYFWRDTPGGELATLPCSEGSEEVATRECSPTGEWQMADLSQCALEEFNELLELLDNGTNVTVDNYEEFVLVITIFVVNAPAENQTDDNLVIVIETARSSSEVLASDPQTIVTEETVNNTVELLDGLDDWDPQVLENSNDVALVVQLFERVTAAFATQENFTNFTLTGEDVTLTAERVDTEVVQSEGRLFSVSSDAGQLDSEVGGDDGNATELGSPQEIASVFLPPSLFQLLGNDSEAQIIFALYEQGQLFPVREQSQSSDVDIVVGTPVIAATVVNLNLSDLTEDQSVVILLRMNDLGNVTVTRTRCVSYDFDNLRWTTEGCRTEVNDDVITCTCNHLTNFAALVDVCSRTDGDCLSEDEQLALEVLSIIGVVLSLIGIVLTIITLLIFKKLRERDVTKYHIQLCIALGLMLLVFVVGIDRTEEYEVCVTVSALIHYFTLVSVMWMGAEAVLMFQKLVIVFVQITTRFIIGVSLVCWLVPIVPVIIPLAIDPDFMITFTDSSEDDIDFCFIGEVGVFFGAFLGPIFAILLFNFVIFFIIIFVLIRHTLGTFKRKQDSMDKKTAVRLLISITGVMFLFGLTWLFGAFTVADASLAFQILFVVFNSLQGFFIFLFICVFSKDTRELWIEKLSCGRYKSKALPPSKAKYTSSGTAATTASSKLAISTLSSKPTSEVPLDYELPVIMADPPEIEKRDLEASTSTFKREPTEGTDTNGAVIAEAGGPEDAMERVPLSAEEEVKPEQENDPYETGVGLKARVQRYSTKYAGKHHVEEYAVDFEDDDIDDDEFPALQA